MRIIANIEIQNVNWEPDTKRLSYTGHGRVDDDGTGSAHGDPDHQNETSLKQNSQSINADLVPFGVLPENVVMDVPGRFLGCQGYMTYKGVRYPLVCADLGPKRRLGEISERACLVAGIDPNPNTGGDDNEDIFFEWFAEQPATIDGITYNLQSA